MLERRPVDVLDRPESVHGVAPQAGLAVAALLNAPDQFVVRDLSLGSEFISAAPPLPQRPQPRRNPGRARGGPGLRGWQDLPRTNLSH